MYISEQKREENIAEYVLYMWQIEDVIRACSFEIDKISTFIIDQQELTEAQKAALKEWYVLLIQKMKLQRIEKVGHLHEVNDVIMEMTYLHNSLLEYYKDEKYAKIYSFAEQFLEEFKKVSNNPNASNIEVFFNALYAKLILKIQGKELTDATSEAFEAFTNVLAYLSAKYNKMKRGEL
jgi:hypothetical protein